MKKIVILFFCLVMFSCKPRDSKKITLQAITTAANSDHGKFKPYKLAEDYLVIDTGEYSNGPMGGSFAIVKDARGISDTIDLRFGIKKIKSSFFFYQKLTLAANSLTTTEKQNGFLPLDFSNFIFTNKSSRINFKNIAPNFDNYFSSPDVLNNKVYYWQLIHFKNSDSIKVSATEFDISTKLSKNVFLFDDMLETDDAGYFPSPYKKSDTIYFDGGPSRLKKFSLDFKPYN